MKSSTVNVESFNTVVQYEIRLDLTNQAILTVIANKIHQYDPTKHTNNKRTSYELILIASHVAIAINLN